MKRLDTEVLIIGAGLAGLSAGHFLEGTDHTIVEAEPEVGGLCRTVFHDGFHFDFTGHLIHFRTEEGRKIIQGLVGNKITQHQRRAAIFIADRFTDYPFQANTFGLPPEMIKECLIGFINTFSVNGKPKIANFYDWIHATFGDGIAKHFMLPYNEKLWQHDLRDIALDWVNWSIPKPNLEDVINGALGIKNRQFGYNPVFYYPSQGGISILPGSIPQRNHLILQNPVTAVETKKRCATLSDGTAVRYRYLFSTMPLHALAATLKDAPSFFTNAAAKLRYVSVLNINVGIDRENVLPYHWVYFPERKQPFYRVGSPSNFSSSVAPQGTSSLFIELSLQPDQKPDIPRLIRESLSALQECGILRKNDRIISTYPLLLKYAYVVYDSARRKNVDRLMRFLNSRDCYSFGRYGSWIYSSMEDAILQGKEFAEKLKSFKQ